MERTQRSFSDLGRFSFRAAAVLPRFDADTPEEFDPPPPPPPPPLVACSAAVVVAAEAIPESPELLRSSLKSLNSLHNSFSLSFSFSFFEIFPERQPSLVLRRTRPVIFEVDESPPPPPPPPPPPVVISKRCV